MELTKLKHEFKKSSDFLVALGDEKRQMIIIALLDENAIQRGLRVTDLTIVTDLSRPAVSHHLKILKDVNLVDFQTKGTKNYYYLTHQTKEINQLQLLLEHVIQVVEERQCQKS